MPPSVSAVRATVCGVSRATCNTRAMCGYAPLGRTRLTGAIACADPEFFGNVASVETRGFHFDMEKSAGNQCYHWNNNAQSYWALGQAMGKAFMGMVTTA